MPTVYKSRPGSASSHTVIESAETADGSEQSANLSERRKSGPPLMRFNYQLPSVIASFFDGWKSTAQSCTVISMCSALISTLLLLFAPDPISTSIRTLLATVSYSSVILNVIAAIFSSLLVHRIGTVFTVSSCVPIEDRYGPNYELVLQNNASITDAFGGKQLYLLAAYSLFCFGLGIVCLGLQFFTLLWIRESKIAAIVTTSVSGIIFSPVIIYLFTRNPL